MRLGNKAKLLLLGTDSVVITVIVMIVIGIWQTRLSSSKSIEQVNSLISSEMQTISLDVNNLLTSQDESIQLQVASGMNVLQKLINDEGGLKEGNTLVDWDAQNQLTKESIRVQIPGLNLGANALGKTSDAAIPVPAVDELYTLTGARATLFQPMPDGAGLLRVATNVKTVNGTRAIGTYIPAKNADGSPNTVYSVVMGGEDYTGVAFVVDAWYVTKYHPIVDDSGKTIAVLFVGVKEESVASLRKAIQNTKVGQTGYVSVVGGKGDQKGKYIISKDGANDGKSLLSDSSTGNDTVYQELVEKAVTLKTGETMVYNTLSEIDGSKKILQVSYYAPWDWVIIVNGYLSDYQTFFDRLEKNQSDMIGMFALFGVLLMIIGFLIVNPLATSLSKPIINLTEVSKKLAKGDIEQDISSNRKDEIGDLIRAFKSTLEYMQEMAKTAGHIASGDLSVKVNTRGDNDSLGLAFNKMIANLKDTISSLQHNAVALDEASNQLTQGADQVNEATSQIASTIQEISKGSTQQAESVNKSALMMEKLENSVRQVEKGSIDQAKAVEQASLKSSEIISVMQEVTQNVNFVQDQASQAFKSASDGYQNVQGTLNGMHLIQEKVKLSAGRVDEMGIRSMEIGKIVETIDDIASQTNLLALNAAIEAARAGESGKGFAVVADEVRKLAERSSQSTREIGDLVKHIQSTVKDAIAAMQESSSEVDSGVIQAEKSGESLKDILKMVESVNDSAGQAARAANEIGLSINDLVSSINHVAIIVGMNKKEVDAMTENTESTHDAIENIASISQENSAAVEEVSASTEEVSAQMAEFRNSVIGLSAMAKDLATIAAKFSIE